jgi:hypothetical protein
MVAATKVKQNRDRSRCSHRHVRDPSRSRSRNKSVSYVVIDEAAGTPSIVGRIQLPLYISTREIRGFFTLLRMP